jgi:hypothetical protein
VDSGGVASYFVGTATATTVAGTYTVPVAQVSAPFQCTH